MEKALLVVSFGTSYKETRDKTICALEQDLRDAFPDRAFYRAWTSNIIIKKIAKTEGLHVDTIEEAILHMKADGVKDVLMQSSHMTDGYENDRVMKLMKDVKEGFDKVACGKPMLVTEEDIDYMSEAVMAEFPEVKEGKAALVLMAHGTPVKAGEKGYNPESDPNQVYLDQEASFRKLGYGNVFVGTVEATPTLEDTLASLKAAVPAPAKVYIAPYLIVAGDHATNDMAGDEPDSWKNVIAAEGYEAVPVVKGLGEYPKIRARFVRHAKEAEEI